MRRRLGRGPASSGGDLGGEANANSADVTGFSDGGSAGDSGHNDTQGPGDPTKEHRAFFKEDDPSWPGVPGAFGILKPEDEQWYIAMNWKVEESKDNLKTQRIMVYCPRTNRACICAPGDNTTGGVVVSPDTMMVLAAQPGKDRVFLGFVDPLTQLGPKDLTNYIKPGKLWDAFVADTAPVLLIDEIDKADIEFPNDLLLELDRMEFFVYELKQTIVAKQRPIVMITSNNEKELPDAFLRRCFFHYIRFPDRETMQRIIDVHFPGLKHDLVHEALTIFFDVRDVPGLKKKPSTSELLDWIKLLLVEDISPEVLRTRDPKKLIPPLHGALLKNEQDVQLFERLAFLHRRERG